MRPQVPSKCSTIWGRYTHRVAISNHRIESLQGNKVTCTYRDRADNDQLKHMTLDAIKKKHLFLRHKS
ncbi:MAG: hypothetical protein C4583_05835 [Anaerolineaceae bacterium]|nr:MAG: hypothetical protein C4583_05835 [Anaerolineaceae bacterium]